MKNPKIMFGSVLLALACFAVSSTALAVPRPTPPTPTPTAAGIVNTVRYERFNAMLLNEFLKEHKTFVEEQEKVTKFETGLTALLATVKEQAAQIEKVSAQHEIRRSRQTLARNIP